MKAPASSRLPGETICCQMTLFSGTLFQHLANWVSDQCFVAAHRRYLEELEQRGELDAMLESLNLTRAELTGLPVSPLASLELFTRMLQHAKVESHVITETESEDGERNCRVCTNWKLCRRWLTSGAKEDRYRSFCANADLVDRLRSRSRKDSVAPQN